VTNKELREIELPEIQGKFNFSASLSREISVKNEQKTALEKREETKFREPLKFKPGLFINLPAGLFLDLKGKLRMNLLGLDVGLMKYKRLQIFNFGLGINDARINNPKLELYGKFAPVKYNLYKNLYAEVNVASNTKGEVLFGLGFSLKF
jgi:hypothetical protein